MEFTPGVIGSMADDRVGLIGVGLLGSALAERFLEAGLDVLGFDVDEGARRRLVELGGSEAATPGEAAGCRRVVLSLPDERVVASVLEELGETLRERTIVVDTTTGDPDVQARLGIDLAERGVMYLDATVGGSSQHVREGRAVVMAGGDAGAIEACRDLFDCFASRTIHVGGCGSGGRMKLVTNLVLGLNRAALAEGLGLAEKFELDDELVLEALQAGPAWSRAADDKGHKMITGDFSPQARLAQHRKDVERILQAGERNGAGLPLSEVHLALLESVEAAGYGDEDNSAVVRAYRDDPG